MPAAHSVQHCNVTANAWPSGAANGWPFLTRRRNWRPRAANIDSGYQRLANMDFRDLPCQAPLKRPHNEKQSGLVERDVIRHQVYRSFCRTILECIDIGWVAINGCACNVSRHVFRQHCHRSKCRFLPTFAHPSANGWRQLTSSRRSFLSLRIPLPTAGGN